MRYKNNIAKDGGRYHVRKMVCGRIVQRTFPTRRSAVMYLEHVVLEAAGVHLADLPRTLTEALDEYVARRVLLGRSAATLEYYATHRKAIEAAFGGVHLDRISQRTLEDYIAARRQEVGNGTVNKELMLLRSVYRHHDMKPPWRIELLTHTPKRRRVHPPEVVRAIWPRLSRPTQCAVGLCLFAAFRAAEVQRATAAWVHGNEIDCEIEKSGGDQNRTWLVGTLRDILPKRGKLVTKRKPQIEWELLSLSRELGIDPPYRGPGAFRHHCSTYAIDLGYPRDHVKLVLGHRFGDVTDRYLHSQQIEKKRRTLEAVESLVIRSLQIDYTQRRELTLVDSA